MQTTTMENNKNGQGHPQAGTMLNQKTNEDFNKKQPNLNDPNEKNAVPNNDVPNIGDDEIDPIEGEAIDPKNEKPDIQAGSDPSTDVQTSQDKTDDKGTENFKSLGSE